MNRVINILKKAREKEINLVDSLSDKSLILELTEVIALLINLDDSDDEDACNVTDCKTCETEGD